MNARQIREILDAVQHRKQPRTPTNFGLHDAQAAAIYEARKPDALLILTGKVGQLQQQRDDLSEELGRAEGKVAKLKANYRAAEREVNRLQNALEILLEVVKDTQE